MEGLITLKIPKSDTGDPRSEGYENLAIPPSATTEGKLEIIFESLNRVVNKEIELEKKLSVADKKVEDYKRDIDRQSNRAIEIIGIFSAVLALLIMDVSIIKSVDSFLSAILLITALTCSMVVFVTVIHIFFTPKDKNKFGKFFCIPIGILILLVILGIAAYLCGVDLNQIKKAPELLMNDNATTPILPQEGPKLDKQ